MTVSTTYSPIVSPGNGTAAAITVTWPFFEDTDLVVTAIDADGVETIKTISVDYTVTGGADSDGLPATGTVTPTAVRASGTSWRLERATPKTQATTWDAFEKFPESAVEAALDRLTLIAQEAAAGGGGSGGITLDTSGATDFWNAGAYPVRSSATPADDDDLITKAYADDTYSAAAAATSADEAATSATTATTQATNAATSADEAATSATTATTQATNAATSATSAATSATSALAAAGFTFTYSTATTMADPGSGGVRFNNATLASVTAIAISDLAADSGNPDVSPWVLTWDDSTNTPSKGMLRLRKRSDAAVYADFSVSSLTDNAGWTQLAVAYVGSNGALSNADVVVASFVPVGNKGANGEGAGDVVGPAASVDSEIALYDGTTGKLLKRASTTGLLKATSGVLAAAAAGTDYCAATSGSAVLKGNGSGGTTAAAASDLGAGTHTLWIPSAAMTARTTNGAAVGTTELATNKVMLATYDFDTTTEEGVGFMIAMPKSWNESTVTFKAFWTAASGSGGVAWGLAAYALSDDDAMDVAVSGQKIVTDTLLAANDMHITAESSAITIGGTPAEGDVVYFELTREVANGSDTLAVDAKLLGIHIYITTNALTDA